MKRIAVMLISVVIFPAVMQAQVSVIARVYAEVIEVVSVKKGYQVSFGRFSPEIEGGTITITPDGMRTASGSVILAPGRYGPGRILVSGTPAVEFTIMLPNEAVTVTHLETGRTMSVVGWVYNPQLGNGAETLPDGSQEMSIGATIYVGTIVDNPAGIYTGTYMVTLAYN